MASPISDEDRHKNSSDLLVGEMESSTLSSALSCQCELYDPTSAAGDCQHPKYPLIKTPVVKSISDSSISPFFTYSCFPKEM